MDSAYWSYDNIVPSFRLDGKLVILTGGSGGLAAVVSRALLAKGADVALVDMNLEEHNKLLETSYNGAKSK